MSVQLHTGAQMYHLQQSVNTHGDTNSGTWPPGQDTHPSHVSPAANRSTNVPAANRSTNVPLATVREYTWWHEFRYMTPPPPGRDTDPSHVSPAANRSTNVQLATVREYTWWHEFRYMPCGWCQKSSRSIVLPVSTLCAQKFKLWPTSVTITWRRIEEINYIRRYLRTPNTTKTLHFIFLFQNEAQNMLSYLFIIAFSFSFFYHNNFLGFFVIRPNLWNTQLFSCCTLLTHSLTHSRTHPPSDSLTHSFTHARTHARTHSLTYSLTYSLTHPLTHSLTRLLTHPRTHSRMDSLTHSLIHSFIHSFIHSLTRSRLRCSVTAIWVN